jgi:rod shape-determining protein MreD
MKSSQMLIPASIIVAFILQIMPMPAFLDMYRPDWLLLLLCYWTMALPNRVGVGIAALCGVVLDILYGTSLGVHSFAMAIPVYLVAANYQRFRNYSVVQQAVMICILATLYHINGCRVSSRVFMASRHLSIYLALAILAIASLPKTTPSNLT